MGNLTRMASHCWWVESTIEEVTGTLEIDHPNNKSGWKSDRYTQYPILTSREVSHVYYDADMICRGAYHRDDFNYAVDPFVIDSLDNFKKEDLVFEGELLAGGIVPDLVSPSLDGGLQPRIHPNDAETGYPLYQGLGKVTGDLTLNLGDFTVREALTFDVTNGGRRQHACAGFRLRPHDVLRQRGQGGPNSIGEGGRGGFWLAFLRQATIRSVHTHRFPSVLWRRGVSERDWSCPNHR